MGHRQTTTTTSNATATKNKHKSTTATATSSCTSFFGHTPRLRAIFIQTISVPILLACAVWMWTDAATLSLQGSATTTATTTTTTTSTSFTRQRSTSTTLGWMFVCEAFGQFSLIVASHRHVRAEEVGRGNLALPTSTQDVQQQQQQRGADIRVDFHHWMKSEDPIKKWSAFCSYLCFIVFVSLCRFDIAGQALDADVMGSQHSTALLLCLVCLFGPQLIGASCYVWTSTWPCPWYGALIFLLCPVVAGLAMLWRFANGDVNSTDGEGSTENSFWGGVVLLLYMGPFVVYTLGEPYVERWHMEVLSLGVWLCLAVAGRRMML